MKKPTNTPQPPLRSTRPLSAGELKSTTGGTFFGNYDGIDGEAKDKDHKSWSDIAS